MPLPQQLLMPLALAAAPVCPAQLTPPADCSSNLWLCRYDTREGENAPDPQSILPLLRPFALPLEVRGGGQAATEECLHAFCAWPGGLLLPSAACACAGVSAAMHMSLSPTSPALQDMPDRGGVPLLGTTLPVVFPKGGRTPQPAVGAWVKLRNLGARVVQGQLQVRTVGEGAAVLDGHWHCVHVALPSHQLSCACMSTACPETPLPPRWRRPSSTATAAGRRGRQRRSRRR